MNENILVREPAFMDVYEVSEMLGVSKSSAYKVMKSLNNELNSKGFKTLAGKVSRQYFNEKFYGMKA